MNTLKITILAIAANALCACSPKVVTNILVQRDPLPADAQVALLGEPDPAPADGEKLGEVRVGDSGFTTLKHATYEIVSDIAKDKAKDAGGNLVKITEHKAPDFVSSIHRIKADIYNVPDIYNYLPHSVVDTSYVSVSPEQPSVEETEKTSVRGAHSYAAVHSSSAVTKEESLDKITRRPGYRIGVYGGYGYRLAKVQSGLDNVLTNYLKKLKNGFNLGGDFTYFFPSQPTGFSQGIGAKFNFFKAENSLYGTFEYDDGSSAEGIVSNDIFILYSGVMYAMRFISEDRRNIFWLNYGLGLANYIDKGITPKQNITISGSGLSYNLDLGYDFQLVNNLYFGMAASLYTGALAALTYKDNTSGEKKTVALDSKQRESIAQISLAAGLKFHF